MTTQQTEALILEQDEIVIALSNMKKYAQMYGSGTELFRSFQRLNARHEQIQRLLDAA